MELSELKEKARDLMFNTRLPQFPVVFELYVRSFGIETDIDKSMGEIIAIIRTSNTAEVAYNLVSHYLDDLEEEINGTHA